ncbi:hypothetical protein [Plesiomonas shigelloides]|nr:hypothetical protein [Plesiomonas shigelloides]
MKKAILLLFALSIFGCSSTNPPQPAQAKGKWYVINTDIEAIKKGTF